MKNNEEDSANKQASPAKQPAKDEPRPQQNGNGRRQQQPVAGQFNNNKGRGGPDSWHKGMDKPQGQQPKVVCLINLECLNLNYLLSTSYLCLNKTKNCVVPVKFKSRFRLTTNATTAGSRE